MPADLELARGAVENGGYSVAFAAGGKIIARGTGGGIAPLLEALEGIDASLAGIAAADRVVGLAAALFLKSPQVGVVYGQIMSRGARAHLEAEGIDTVAGDLVPRIMNRDNTGACPMEKMAMGEDNPDVARERIRTLVRGDE